MPDKIDDNRLKVALHFDRETKGAIRYKQAEEDPKVYSIGTMYIRKHVLGGNKPAGIVVNVEFSVNDA